ncbi:MAG: lytic transglycosylase domain-containing protein [Cryomorphaceae bacterium]|nr:lytic transglycosylase domain-containing protein [Flavobacteriales bacterium]
MNSLFNTFAKKLFAASCAIFVLGMTLIVVAFSMEDEEVDPSYQKYFNENYKIFSLNTPDNIAFAGEEVPLQILDVREKLDRELLVNTYWQSQSLLFHKRANRWFPVIEPILEKNGVPDDFKYLAVIESGLTNVVSPAGATGYWQLLKHTGREYGLEINNEVDERYHVEKSTEAACKYLKDAYKIYGSWTLAAASYNMGMTGLNRQIERQQVFNYYDLLLNEETGRYLYRILALKEILGKPSLYGFHFRPKDLYTTYEVEEVMVDTAVDNFADFAEQQEINYKILKILNPWLREAFITNPKNKAYLIKIPIDKTAGLVPFEPAPKQISVSDSLSGDTIIIDQ